LHENLSYSLFSLSSFFVLSLKENNRKKVNHPPQLRRAPPLPTPTQQDVQALMPASVSGCGPESTRRVTETCSPRLAQSRRQ